MKKKTILLAWSWLLALSLLSCNALDSGKKEAAPARRVALATGPDSGYNTTVNIAPTNPGQPRMWVGWNFNGNVTATTPPTYSVFLGSDDTSFKVGGATAQQGVDYTLVITDLTGSSPSATLTPTAGGTAQTVSVTSIELSTESFEAHVRETNPPSANLNLCVTHTGGGVRVLLEDA